MTDIGRRGKGSSKRGTKDGSSRPGLQDSLEELTRLADDLVDSLSDDETVEQAPAEQAAAEEIFLDLDDNYEEAVNVAIEEPADEPEVAEVASTVAPVEAPEEFEVVEPSEQPPAARASETEVTAPDDGTALQETLEELDLIGQQEPPAVQRFEVEFAGDKGQDIDAHLDTLFGADTSEQPPEPAPEPAPAVAVESAELSFEELADAEIETEVEVEVEATPIEQVAVTPESREVTEQQDVPEPAPSIFDEIEDPPRPASETTDFHVALEGNEPSVDPSVTTPAVETVAASHEGSRSRKWLAVAAVFVVVVTVGSWMFFSRTSSDNAPVAAPSSQQASLVLPEPVVSEAPPPSAIASEPESEVETPTPAPVKVAPPATVPEPIKKSTPPPVKVAAPVAKPTPPPAKVAEPIKKPTPPPVKVAEPIKKPTPPPVKVAEPIKKPTPPPVKVATPVEEPTPPPVKAAAPIEIAALVEIPTPAAVETPPAVLATPAAPPMRVEPPEVVTRIEPVLTKKARKEQGTVVLNVLVNESGRVVRVVVDEGIPGSALEAASIDAVLRWKYRAGTENGSPVRAWVTETFVFEP